MLPGGRKPIFFINNGRYNTLPIFLCGVTLKALASHFKKFHLNKFDWESKRNNFLSLNLFLSIFFLERYNWRAYLIVAMRKKSILQKRIE